MRFIVLVGCVLLSACGGSNYSYTLYRNSVTDANMRVHIATFDASESEAYNNENCNLGAKLFQAQELVSTRFWCEKGPYRK